MVCQSLEQIVGSLNDAVSSLNFCEQTLSDWIITQMLQDMQSVDSLLSTNVKYLHSSYERTTQFLDEHEITYVPSRAGYFIYGSTWEERLATLSKRS